MSHTEQRPERRRVRAVAPAVLGVSLLALTGCGSEPISLPDDDTAICTVAIVGERAIVGDAFEVSGTEPITIDHVTLADATGIDVIEAVLLISSDGTVLTAAPYPPPADINWDSRIDAAGAVADPLGIHSLALVVERTDADATASGISITYSRDGTQYTAQTKAPISVADSCPLGDS